MTDQLPAARASGEGAASPPDLEERTSRFLDANKVFSRTEFTAALGPHEESEAVDSLLMRQVKDERIKQAAHEVYVVGDPEPRPGRFVAPEYVLASKLRPDGILAYHTALELCGIQHSVIISELQVLSCGPEGIADLPYSLCRFIRPHRALIAAGKTDFLTTSKRLIDIPVRITAFERTLVDVLHRADRACGVDEVIECLNVAPYILEDFDCSKVADYVELVGIRSLAGVVGWWLERWQSELNVSRRTLDRMRAMLPDTYSYALFARPERSELVPEWRIYLSPDALDTTFEGLPPDADF
ncbi:MAG: hypothetical protein F4213_13825 [Boseongicola sp. SB0677_bin_26]|nr:hypothetical protein [Boseongicola sp. SB0665_bin_10]MYG27080.1 hypothetical protein [Boseongicola sp. SB0677_bin_26]